MNVLRTGCHRKMKPFFAIITICFTILSFPSNAAEAEIDLSGMQLHALIVTVGDKQVSGKAMKDYEGNNFSQGGQMMSLVVGKPEILKVELEDETGKRVDVTHDPRTTYQVMGNRVKVGNGIVEGLEHPIPGKGTFGLDDEAAVIIQFEALDSGSTDRSPKGKAGSVYVYFKVLKKDLTQRGN